MWFSYFKSYFAAYNHYSYSQDVVVVVVSVAYWTATLQKESHMNLVFITCTITLKFNLQWLFMAYVYICENIIVLLCDSCIIIIKARCFFNFYLPLFRTLKYVHDFIGRGKSHEIEMLCAIHNVVIKWGGQLRRIMVKILLYA